MRSLNNFIRWLTVCLALAAFAATAAHAGVRPNDRAGTLGVGSQSTAADTSDVVSRYLRSHATRPNDRAGSLGAAGVVAAPPPDVFERYAAEHPYGAGLAETAVVTTGGFRWSDYGAGVGTGIVAVLLLAGAFVATPTRRKQRTQPAIGG
jgi:hypothetical protein